MLGSTLGACLFLLVTAFLPGDVLSVVLVAALVIAAGVFGGPGRCARAPAPVSTLRRPPDHR